MTERERLMKILSITIYPREGADPAEVVADFLLDSGVVLPPCRCKDCEYCENWSEDSVAETAKVELVCGNSELYDKVREDDYCPYGKRREDNGT